jgi:hypothetical protein
MCVLVHICSPDIVRKTGVAAEDDLIRRESIPRRWTPLRHPQFTGSSTGEEDGVKCSSRPCLLAYRCRLTLGLLQSSNGVQLSSGWLQMAGLVCVSRGSAGQARERGHKGDASDQGEMTTHMRTLRQVPDTAPGIRGRPLWPAMRTSRGDPESPAPVSVAAP